MTSSNIISIHLTLYGNTLGRARPCQMANKPFKLRHPFVGEKRVKEESHEQKIKSKSFACSCLSKQQRKMSVRKNLDIFRVVWPARTKARNSQRTSQQHRQTTAAKLFH